MDRNDRFKIKNRSAGVVIYSIPERNIRREFAPGEIKELTFDEIEALSNQPGGREMMQNYLQCLSKVVIDSVGIKAEPEYFYSEQDIINLMTTGSLDEFLDCLDFADLGVIDLIKDFSVRLPLNDFDKARALKNKTGFDCLQAVKLIQQEKEQIAKAAGKDPAEVDATPKRRVQQQAAAPTTGRRAAAPETKEDAEPETGYKLPEYKIVKQ